MRVVETAASLRKARQELSGTVGLVPTMGYLHEGHLALVRAAREECDSVVVSIFVNPAQFGPHEDYAAYPRDMPRDLALLERGGVDVVFAPPLEEMYPAGFGTFVKVEGLTERLEGASRPGYFRGVTTVVGKLLNLIQPDRAYFGRKDAQQLRVVRKMVADLGMPIEIVGVETVREPDGLAMSSRNSRLNPQQRQVATILYRALQLARKLWEEGERDAATIRAHMRELIEGEPLARIDYISIADDESLAEQVVVEPPALVSLAVWIGSVRLIDNISLSE